MRKKIKYQDNICEYTKICNYSVYGKHCQYTSPYTRCPQWTKFKFEDYLEDKISKTKIEKRKLK